MNVKFGFIGCLVSACVIFSIRCATTPTPSSIAGNSSQTPNAVMGSIVEPDGNTPAKNIRVFLRMKNSLPVFSPSGSPKDTASVLTNEAGQFSFTIPGDKEMYVIEASSGSNAVFIDSIAITRQIESMTLPPDTLKPAGAIKGTIKLSGGGDPTKVYVLAFGIDRFATVKSDGSFVFYPLAHGSYSLRILSTLANYGILDTVGVKVNPADTTNLGALYLPYSGIPVPSAVGFSIDTIDDLNRAVTIRWSAVDTALIKGYALYSKEIISGSTVKKMYTVQDTFCIDTCYRTGYEILEYQVACIDRQNAEGPKSPPLRIKSGIVPLVEAQGTIGQGQLGAVIAMAMDADQNFWVADYEHDTMRKYGPTGVVLTQWDIEPHGSAAMYFPGSRPSALALDAHKNIYLKDLQSQNILKYDSAGNLLGKISDPAAQTLLDVCVDDSGYIFCNFLKNSGSNQWIDRFNPDLTLNSTWEAAAGISSQHGLLCRNGTIYCAGGEGGNTDCRIEEITKYETPTGGYGNPYVAIHADEFTIDKNGLFYAVDAANNLIWLCDTTSTCLGCFEVNSGMVSMSDYLFGISIMNDGTIALGVGQPDSHSCVIQLFRRAK
jgi:hypothetical protein